MKLTEELEDNTSKNGTINGESEKTEIEKTEIGKVAVPAITETRTIDDVEWPANEELTESLTNGHDTTMNSDDGSQLVAEDNLSDISDESLTLHVTDDEADKEDIKDEDVIKDEEDIKDEIDIKDEEDLLNEGNEKEKDVEHETVEQSSPTDDPSEKTTPPIEDDTDKDNQSDMAIDINTKNDTESTSDNLVDHDSLDKEKEAEDVLIASCVSLADDNDELDDETEILEKPVEEAPEKSTEEAAKKSIEETPEKSDDDVQEKSTKESPEKSTEESPEKSIKESPEQSTEEAPENSAEETAKKSAVEVLEKSPKETSNKPSEDISKKSTEDTSKKSTEETTEKIEKPEETNDSDKSDDLLEPRSDYFSDEESKDIDRPDADSNSEMHDLDEEFKDENMDVDYKIDEDSKDGKSDSTKNESEFENTDPEGVIEEIDKILSRHEEKKQRRKRKKEKKLAKSLKSKKDKSSIEKWNVVQRKTFISETIERNEDSDEVPLTLRIKQSKKKSKDFTDESECKASDDDDAMSTSSSDTRAAKRRRVVKPVSYAELDIDKDISEDESNKKSDTDKIKLKTVSKIQTGHGEDSNDSESIDNPESLDPELDEKSESEQPNGEVDEEEEAVQSDHNENDSVETEAKSDDTNDGVKEKIEEDIKDEEPTTGRKRSLDASEDKITVKKPKIDLEFKTKIEKKEYVPLSSFKELLNKIEKFNRKNLEEFCVQKICELMGQHSELGELRQQLRAQEKEIESWRLKYSSISKQAKDLEIVKTRLITDMRNRERDGLNPNEAAPVKITRSVGLQVGIQTNSGQRRLSVPSSPNTPNNTQANQPMHTPITQGDNRRKQVRQSLPTRQPNTPNTPTTPVNKNVVPILPAPQQKTPTQKTIKTIPPVRTPEVKEQGSLLNKALQKPPGKKESKGVIDLTDEDESNKEVAKPTVPSGIRIVTSAISTTPITSTASLVATTAQGPRLTYLVTNGSNGQPGQPLILHNFQAGTQARPTHFKSVMLKPYAASPPGPRATLRLPSGQPVVVSSGTRPQLLRTNNIPSMRATTPRVQNTRHPAPLPGPPPLQASQPNWKAIPPRPSLKISRVGDGIVLSWKILAKDLSIYEEIASYQLFAYQETNSPPNTEMWRKVGDVKALALPMACTLTQFTEGNKYHFAVRAVDVKSRVGPFSPPEQITLTN